jgi:flagellar biosynthesis protein FlhG
MSGKTTLWLESQHSRFLEKKLNKTVKISIASGKGGVGKTSCALNFAKVLSDEGHKVLLVDCDFNLSNTAVKLGIPLNDHFYSLISSKISFDDAVYKDGNFHLLSACNGNNELFNNGPEMGQLILDIISSHEDEYDIIILDCPAGLNKDVCTLSAYCDYRFVVVTPDKSSITDSYSLIKVLNQNYSIGTNHLIFNKISDKSQYLRLAKTFLDTTDRYLNCSVKILGALPFFTKNLDRFDHELIKVADSKIHKHFSKIILSFAEKNIHAKDASTFMIDSLMSTQKGQQEVQAY